jgi:DNA-binding XRE family transcriptional regulator
MGKTTLSFQSAKYMSPNFDLSHVYWTPDSFLEALRTAQKGDTLVFDEAMLLSSRSALSAINRMIVIAMSMIRSKNLFIIFNVNSIFDIDRNLALSRADLLLHCYGDSLTDKGKFLAFFKGGDGMDRIKDLYINGKKYYSYSQPKANFYTTFSSYFVVDEEEYEKKKQEGVNNFLKGAKENVNNKNKISRDKYIRYIYKTYGLTQEEVAEIGGIDDKTVARALKEDESNNSGRFR